MLFLASKYVVSEALSGLGMKGAFMLSILSQFTSLVRSIALTVTPSALSVGSTSSKAKIADTATSLRDSSPSYNESLLLSMLSNTTSGVLSVKGGICPLRTRTNTLYPGVTPPVHSHTVVVLLRSSSGAR